MTDNDTRRLDRIEADIQSLKADGQAVSARLMAVETRKEADAVHQANVEKRLAAIEDGQKWLTRLVFGAVMAAAVIFVIDGGLAP